MYIQPGRIYPICRLSWDVTAGMLMLSAKLSCLWNTRVVYFPLSNCNSISKYKSDVGHSVAFFSAAGYNVVYVYT